MAGELEATPPPLPDLAAGDIAGEALDRLMERVTLEDFFLERFEFPILTYRM